MNPNDRDELRRAAEFAYAVRDIMLRWKQDVHYTANGRTLRQIDDALLKWAASVPEKKEP